MSQKYDAIILGSGVGGLTCGAFLARAGMKVLVLEQHTKIGGYAHNFKRRKFIFESGIHSVSLGQNGFIMHLLRLLGIENKIETIEFPEMFGVKNPEFSMVMPAKKEEICDYLYGTFPHQKDNIDNFIKEIDSFKRNIIDPQLNDDSKFTHENVSFVSQFHNQSYKSFLDNLFTDDKLRYLFSGQWPYVGSSPEYGPALFSFMMFLVHFLEGSHFCKNGFSTIADALASVITECGGDVKTRSRALSLAVRGKQAYSVTTIKGEEYEADTFVSNINPHLLHNELIEEPYRGKRWQKRLAGLRSSTSCVIVYCGMRPGFEEVIPNNITFWYASLDNEKIFQNVLNNKKDSIDHLISLKTNGSSEYPTLTFMNFVEKSYATDWKSEKMRIAERMLAKADEVYPGIREYIVLTEVGSPTTFERYTANGDGAIYGFENTKSMYGEAKMPFMTHLDNLFQTGHWGKPGGGIWNVMSNAHAASKLILNGK